MTTFRMRTAVVPLLLLTTSVGAQQTATSPSTTVAAPAQQTARLGVEGMHCAMCPATVKAAMTRVAGVIDVRVDYRSATAEVVFDPARTDPLAIAAASSAIGYPARPIE
ncbi:heavy-metal-associated domain-containing protein [Elioraea sp.]|uniref:heavy-metal-associated domain-containing protein n=1 Tax=Elioraea sp. TaxID=2185103 RepID=UPI003F6F6EC4